MDLVLDEVSVEVSDISEGVSLALSGTIAAIGGPGALAGKANNDLSSISATAYGNVPAIAVNPVVGIDDPRVVRSQARFAYMKPDNTAVDFGLISTITCNVEGVTVAADTVAGYFAAKWTAPAVTLTGYMPDGWALNPDVEIAAGCGRSNMRGIEVDYNNFAYAANLLGPLSSSQLTGQYHYGVDIAANGSFIATAALIVSNIPQNATGHLWDRGIGVGPASASGLGPVATSSFYDFGDAATVLEVPGPHTFGLKLTGAIGSNILNGSLLVGSGTLTPQAPLHVHCATDQNLHVQGKTDEPNGITLVSTNDAGTALQEMELLASGLAVNASQLAFFGAATVPKPTVTGAKGGNVALASLLTALASLGLITDASSA